MQTLFTNSLARTPLWVVGAVLLSSCGAPLGPIPGGELHGVHNPWPSDWSYVEDIENVLLETNPDNPYSVTIWGVGIGEDFFVGASKRSNQWARNIEANPHVTLDVEGKLYPALAVRVVDAELSNTLGEKFIAKYDMDPETLATNDGAFYHLRALTP